MDKQVVALLIPIMALAIPVAAVVFYGLQKVMRLRIEEARVRAGGLGAGGSAELESLRADVAHLQHELVEVQERLDFTERMLAQTRERDRLPGAPGPD